MVTQTKKKLEKLIIGNDVSREKVYTDYYNKYKQETYWYCLCLTKNENEAQDVFQEGWMKFWENLKYKNKILQPVKCYLFKILHNKHIDKIRKNQIFEINYIEEVDNLEIGSGVNIERDVFVKDNIEQIMQLVKKLNPINKEVFILYWINDLKYEEIAEILNIKKSAVSTRVYRATEKIRLELKKNNIR